MIVIFEEYKSVDKKSKSFYGRDRPRERQICYVILSRTDQRKDNSVIWYYQRQAQGKTTLVLLLSTTGTRTDDSVIWYYQPFKYKNVVWNVMCSLVKQTTTLTSDGQTDGQKDRTMDGKIDKENNVFDFVFGAIWPVMCWRFVQPTKQANTSCLENWKYECLHWSSIQQTGLFKLKWMASLGLCSSYKFRID